MPKAQPDATPATRESILAELAKLDETGEPKEEKEAEPEATEEPAVEAAETEEPKEEPKEEPVEAAAEEAEAEPEKPEPKPDAASKALEATHRAERRHKEAMAAREREFESRWRPTIEKAERFEKQIEPALTRDPIGALLQAGYLRNDPAVLDRAARRLYAMAKGSTDPKYAASAEAEQTRLEYESRLNAQDQELAAIRAERAAEKTEQTIRQYIGGVARLANDDTPALSRLLKIDEDEAHDMIRRATEQLVNETGERPDEPDVLKRVEAQQIAKLKRYGVDPDVVFKKQPKTPTPTADEKRPAKTLSNRLGTPTTPKPERLSDEELREKTLRELRELESRPSE